LICPVMLPVRGCHPVSLAFPDHSSHNPGSAGPRSLATTSGVSVDFLSSGYLDVSVPRVRFFNPMYSGKRYLVLPAVKRHVRRRSNNNEQSGGLPHSDIHGSKPIPGSPWLNAGYHVLHRLLLPRHPPNALIALDSTRKEQGRTPFVKCSHPSGRKSSSHGGTTPCRVYHRSVVLDLEQFRACRNSLATAGQMRPSRGGISTKPMCFSLNDVKRGARGPRTSHRTTQPADAAWMIR
jgi:hypothetical protein